MSFPAYDEYKDSEVEWLGVVPLHWDVDRFKRSTASCRNGIWGSETQGNENDIKCVRVADFDRERLTASINIPTIRNVTESERNGRTLSRGNLLLEKSGGGDLQPVGFVVLYDSDEPAVCSNFVAKVELAEGMHPSFWRYCHAAAYAVRLNYKSIKQTSGIQNLDQSQYLDERAPFPSEEEQKAIASFLDTETSKIDGLVLEQRRLIGLLKEKRQAVISHAVTKGLNPNTPMKPTGIQWLGDVPQHWSVIPLHRVVQDQRRITYGIVQPGKPDKNGRFMIRNQDFTNGWADLETIFRVSAAIEEPYERARFKTGDLLMTIVGAGIGNVAVIPEWLDGANTTQNIARIAIEPTKAHAPFIAEVLRGPIGTKSIEYYSKGAAQPSLNLGHLREFVVTVPPLDEQRDIADFIESQAGPMDTLQAEAERAIELLQERRTALISAAVTGKIDVREFAPEVTT